MTSDAPKRKPGRPPSILGPKAVRFEVAQKKLARLQKQKADHDEKAVAIDKALEAAAAEFEAAKADFADQLNAFSGE